MTIEGTVLCSILWLSCTIQFYGAFSGETLSRLTLALLASSAIFIGTPFLIIGLTEAVEHFSINPTTQTR
jgi:hypothetical protein